MRRTLLALAAASALTGCEITPSHVSSADIDDALARRHYKTMCVGLEMRDDDVRRHAADRLESIADNDPPDPKGLEIGRDCVCEHLVDDRGELDLAIAEGLKGSQRDDMVGCLAEVAERPDLPNKAEAVRALANTAAKVGRDGLARIAQDTATASEIRVAATQAIAGNADYRDVLLKLATQDSDPAVRAAAALGIAKFEGDDVIAALRKLATEDPEGSVRGAALAALKKARAEGIDELLCTAMMEDESPEVRSRAILAFKGTKRPEAIRCLRTRAFTEEPDASVRGALLTVLKSSPSQDAADVLCDAIPAWVRWYGKDDMPDVVPNADIAKAQNDRDWERSYQCLQRAYSQRGSYSCYGKRYVGWWFKQVGGNGFVNKCPPKYPD
ncbi:MAG: hypothetical protein D6798_08890 [Deltaproteobacteria bacterium]|nr:MAG: hypothetical protein D6798_08890 [Deltaproteobacteria bacterium]